MEAEPVVSFCDFAEVDDEFVRFLYDFGCFDEHVALRFGYGEYQVLAFVVMDFDFEASVEEPGGNFGGIELSDVIERDIDSRWGSSYFTNFF